jgi:hypothetical protein
MITIVVGRRGDGLLRQAISMVKDEKVMVVNTMRGIDESIKQYFENSGLNVVIYGVSEAYFDMRLQVKDMKTLKKLVKKIINEIVKEMRSNGVTTFIIYRANDLPPFVFNESRDVVVEEFWRLLTTDLRLTGYEFIFVCEKLSEDDTDILSLFADVEVRISSNRAMPEIRREY